MHGTDLHVASLPSANLLQQAPGFRLDQQGIILLILCPPDFQHAHGLITQLDCPDINLCPKGVNDLLDYIAVATSPLVMDLLDGIVCA